MACWNQHLMPREVTEDTEYTANLPSAPSARPSSALLDMIAGARVSQAIYVAAQLGIADLLSTDPLSAEDLAARCNANAPSLRRVLRALASLGVFEEDARGRFGLTPIAESLRSDAPGSLRSMALFFGDAFWWEVMGDLLHTVQTGEPAIPHLHGVDMWEYLASHPHDEAVFNDVMRAQTERQTVAILDAYDFAGIRTICDVGGGHGSLLAAILAKYPSMCGILFDQASVAGCARPILAEAGVADRCEVVGGNMFEALPSGADSYLAKMIFHDWSDEAATRLLACFHRSMEVGARLLLVDHVIEPGNGPQMAKLLDLSIMTQLSGRERTAKEWEALLLSSGFGALRIVPTRAQISVIEAVKE